MSSLQPQEHHWGLIGLFQFLPNKENTKVISKKSGKESAYTDAKSWQKFVLALKILFGARVVTSESNNYAIVPRSELKKLSYKTKTQQDTQKIQEVVSKLPQFPKNQRPNAEFFNIQEQKKTQVASQNQVKLRLMDDMQGLYEAGVQNLEEFYKEFSQQYSHAEIKEAFDWLQSQPKTQSSKQVQNSSINPPKSPNKEIRFTSQFGYGGEGNSACTYVAAQWLKNDIQNARSKKDCEEAVESGVAGYQENISKIRKKNLEIREHTSVNDIKEYVLPKNKTRESRINNETTIVDAQKLISILKDEITPDDLGAIISVQSKTFAIKRMGNEWHVFDSHNYEGQGGWYAAFTLPDEEKKLVTHLLNTSMPQVDAEFADIAMPDVTIVSKENK